MAMETYSGHVRTPQDAIILFEACRLGLLPRVQRRLSEKERQQIKSGSVFVWDESEAGMRRWTDGKSWSASRVSGSFLTYREMEGKRGNPSLNPNQPADPARRTPEIPPAGPPSDSGPDSGDDGPDGYRYKPDGLMKQSFSITTQANNHLHLISYFARSHPTASTFNSPSTDPSLRHIRPPKGMYPESTVQEQQNVPAVTRTPLQSSGLSTIPQTAAYAKQSLTPTTHGHPQGPPPAYSSNHPQPGYWPPQGPLQNGHGQPGYVYQYAPSNPPVHYSPFGYPHQAQNHIQHQPHYPSYQAQPYTHLLAQPNGHYQQAAYFHRPPGAYGDTLPPPSHYQHQRSLSSGSRPYQDSPITHHTPPMIQQPTPPTPQQQSFDPSAYPQGKQIAPRLRVRSPSNQQLPPFQKNTSNGTSRSRSQSPLPPPNVDKSPCVGGPEALPDRSRGSASEASTRPSIGAIMNGNSPSKNEAEKNKERSTSKSPGSQDAASQYLANEKAAYSGEDQRALRQLDRAFKT